MLGPMPTSLYERWEPHGEFFDQESGLSWSRHLKKAYRVIDDSVRWENLVQRRPELF